MPSEANYPLVRYEDGLLTVGLAPPTDVGGWAVQLTVMKHFGGSGFILRSVASGYIGVSGMTILDSGVGVFQASINSPDSSGRDPGNYAFLLERVDSGFNTVLTRGYMTLTPGR